MLGLGPATPSSIPELAYPTYEVGARLAGAQWVRADSMTALGPRRVALVWVNSPSNPTGRVLPAEHLRKVVAWARERGAVVASDECYLSLARRDSDAMSVLHPDVCGGCHEGLLAVHSLSKPRTSPATAPGSSTGDPALVAGLLEVRKHAGMIMPAAGAGRDGRRRRPTTRMSTAQAQVYARRRAALRGRAGGGRAASSSTPRRGCTSGRPRASPPV